jgi:diguanylate cyclase (GGDEF)-like protein
MSDDTAHFIPADNRRPDRLPACVVLIYGGDLGRKFELSARPSIVGRDSDCDIALDLLTVSRRHASLYERDGLCYVEDLGSTNGTLVNDEEIAEARVLRNGDHVKIGSAVFKYIEGGNIEAMYHEEIHRLAITDGLTGVANKRAFVEFLERELARAKRHQRPLSLVMLDIDHFKKFNDDYGHLAGDHVLRNVASALREHTGPDELLARYGGEEFAIVLPESDIASAASRCERLRKAVESLVMQWEDHSIGGTISLGASAAEKDDDVASLLARADARLYEAKRRGRNRAVTE